LPAELDQDLAGEVNERAIRRPSTAWEKLIAHLETRKREPPATMEIPAAMGPNMSAAGSRIHTRTAVATAEMVSSVAH
jgi:hypothetical protein